MFDPIKGPSNTAQGPATGDGTEHGDNWHTVVAKINDGFKNVIAVLKGEAAHVVEVIDAGAREELADVREQLAALQIKFDALNGLKQLTALELAALRAAGLTADKPQPAGVSDAPPPPIPPPAAGSDQASLDAVAAALAPATATGEARA